MREIKFRGWDGREMHDVYYVTRKGIGALGNGGMIIPRSDSVHAIMQFTGLKDVNGVEIYEGDIVTNKYNEIAEVKFHTEDIGSCGCCYTAFDGSGFAAFDHNEEGVNLTSCTVIGNIYQNPELLPHD